jgi:hypothetical protein
MGITLEGVRKGKHPRPPKIVVYGGPKVGKSTFCAGIPGAIFLQTEEGLDALDVHAFPLAQSFEDVLQGVGALIREDHEYRAVVVDSLDWLEPLIWAHVCKLAGVDSIEQVGGGYGKGYTETLKHWRRLLDGLDKLRDDKGMTVVLIGHDEVRKMEPPDGEVYDYASLKLHRKAAGVVEEWADVIGYATLRRVTRDDEEKFGQTRRRALAVNGERQLVVGKNPAYVSGNRYGLPDVLPLDWAEVREALTGAFQEGGSDD